MFVAELRPAEHPVRVHHAVLVRISDTEEQLGTVDGLAVGARHECALVLIDAQSQLLLHEDTQVLPGCLDTAAKPDLAVREDHDDHPVVGVPLASVLVAPLNGGRLAPCRALILVGREAGDMNEPEHPKFIQMFHRQFLKRGHKKNSKSGCPLVLQRQSVVASPLVLPAILCIRLVFKSIPRNASIA